MNNIYAIEYLNENEYRKKERAIKKYNMLAYKKLLFEIYPALRDGNFIGVKVNDNITEGTTKYELKLPTDKMFETMVGKDIKKLLSTDIFERYVLSPDPDRRNFQLCAFAAVDKDRKILYSHYCKTIADFPDIIKLTLSSDFSALLFSLLTEIL